MLAAEGAIRQGEFFIIKTFLSIAFLLSRLVQEYGQWQLIEPVMLVEINAPSEFQNAVHALVVKRFGIVSAIDPREDWFTMMAEVNRFVDENLTERFCCV